jgi:hypothetical protein
MDGGTEASHGCVLEKDEKRWWYCFGFVFCKNSIILLGSPGNVKGLGVRATPFPRRRNRKVYRVLKRE